MYVSLLCAHSAWCGGSLTTIYKNVFIHIAKTTPTKTSATAIYSCWGIYKKYYRDEFKFRDLSRLPMVMPQGEIMNIEKFVVVILGAAALVSYL